MRKKKSIIAIGCLIIMLFTCIYPMKGVQLVKAEDTTTSAIDSNGVTWRYQKYQSSGVNYVRLLGTDSTKKEIKIPDKLDGCVVKEIGQGFGCTKQGDMFYQNSTLEKVVIPSTIENISSSAFFNCTVLKNVFFESEPQKNNRKLSIGLCGFAKCENLENVTFPDNLVLLEIGESCFNECSILSVAEFPTDVKMASGAFFNTKMQNVEFKGNVYMDTSTFCHAFDNNYGTVKFDKNAVLGGRDNAAYGALSNNRKLKQITFCGEATLSDAAFYGNKSLEKIVWGTKTSINSDIVSRSSYDNVFYGCKSLKTFEFLNYDEDAQLDFQGLESANVKLDSVIYDSGTIKNSWIKATNVIFKGNIKIAKNIKVTSEMTSSIYCYPYDIDLTNLVAENIMFYGIVGESKDEGYKLKSYVNGQKGCKLNSIVESISANIESGDYILGDERAFDVVIDKSRIKVRVIVKYVKESQLEEQEIMPGDGVTGYVISCNDVVANTSNTFHVTYSGVNGTFKQVIRYKRLESIIAKMNVDPVTKQQVVVNTGNNTLNKKDIFVVANYEDGTSTDVTYQDGCVIDNHQIESGNDNKVIVTYTNPYSGQSASTILMVTGTQSDVPMPTLYKATEAPNKTVSPTPTATVVPVNNSGLNEIITPSPALKATETPNGSSSNEIIPSATPQPEKKEGYNDAKEFNQLKPTLKVKSYKNYFKIWPSLPKTDENVTFLVEYCSEDSGVFYTAVVMDGYEKYCVWAGKDALNGCKIEFRVTARKMFDGNTVKTKTKNTSGMYLMKPLENVNCKVKNKKLVITWKKYEKVSGFIIKLKVSNPKKKIMTKKIKVKKGCSKYVLSYNKINKMFKKLKTKTYNVKACSVVAYYTKDNVTAYSQCIN